MAAQLGDWLQAARSVALHRHATSVCAGRYRNRISMAKPRKKSVVTLRDAAVENRGATAMGMPASRQQPSGTVEQSDFQRAGNRSEDTGIVRAHQTPPAAETIDGRSRVVRVGGEDEHLVVVEVIPDGSECLHCAAR
jgi:hypothetical protein